MKKRTTRSPLLIIAGPTASGKSELAVAIAQRLNGAIISADSRQIYRGLDIGTAKVRGAWKRDNGEKTFFYKHIPHYCLDCASPRTTWTAVDFQRCADAAIADIHKRDKLPILVGGGGFWIDAVVYGAQFPAVAPDTMLRKRLAAESPDALFEKLLATDPDRAAAIDRANPHRIIRAIEIARKLGRVPKLPKKIPRYQTRWIGVRPPAPVLAERIARRALAMQPGLIREVRRLCAVGISEKRLCALGFEYRIALEYIQKRLSKADCIDRLIAETRRYAKRQLTWFCRNNDIRWISDATDLNAAVHLARSLLEPY